MFEIAVLLLACASMWWRPAHIGLWAGPLACASILVASRALSVSEAGRALDDLRDPLLFLVFAVPLAVALDDIGVFGSLAAMVDGGRHLVASLWWLASAVVIVFNLDAAVVLLTPLYIRIARRHGIDAEALAFQPALLACLASGVLPVSNLTNLLIAERLDLGVVDFLANLALPSLAATAVGYVAYRRVFDLEVRSPGVDDPVDRRALRRGLPIVAFVLVGFTLGDPLGVPAWACAAAAVVWASSLARRVRWRRVPIEAVVVASSLAVLVAAAAPHLPLDRLFDSPGAGGAVASIASATVLSNVANNLPTVLAGSAVIDGSAAAWPLLIGANIGAILLVSGSLSTLLWRDTAASNDVSVSARRWSRIAVPIGLPALVVASAAHLAVAHT